MFRHLAEDSDRGDNSLASLNTAVHPTKLYATGIYGIPLCAKGRANTHPVSMVPQRAVDLGDVVSCLHEDLGTISVGC